MCAIVGLYRLPGHGDASVMPLALQMLRAQKNRTDEGLGFCALHPRQGKFSVYRSTEKLSNDPYVQGSKTLPPEFDSLAALAQGRYPTAGASVIENTQPMQNDPLARRPKEQRFAIVFNGNIANAESLRRDIKASVSFEGSSDTEVLMRWIEHIADKCGYWGNWEKVFRELEKTIDGGCSLALLDGAGNFVAYRNAPGLTPLWFAEDREGGLIMTASETHAFENITSNFFEVQAGEAVIYNCQSNSVSRHSLTRFQNPARLNAAEVIYTADSHSKTGGKSNYKTRELVGMGMAQYLAPQIGRLSADMRANILIVPVPNTGVPYGKGFRDELIRRKILPRGEQPEAIKRLSNSRNNISRDRSFMADSDEERLMRAERKHQVVAEVVDGKIVCPFDDSFVRAFTSRVITRKLWSAGAAEIHWKFGSPPFIGADYYGVDISTLGELGFWQIWKQAAPAEQRQLFGRAQDGTVKIDLDLFSLKVAEKLISDATQDLIAKGEPVPPPIPVTVSFTPLEILQSSFPGGAENYSFHLHTGQYPTREGQARFDRDLAQVMKLAA